MHRIALETFGRRPREALMWVPRALDVACIAEVCKAAGPRVADVGAGTGLLAALLKREGVQVKAYDPEPPPVLHHPVERRSAEDLDGAYDAVIVSWMEAGKDYREAVASLAPVVINAYDVEGGCGIRGAVDFARHGLVVASWWRTPSFEDVLFALERPGRGLRRNGYPGNRVDVLTRYKALADALADVVEDTQAGPPLPWEREMDALGL